jgi:cupin fold WbuC family metalloprotein
MGLRSVNEEVFVATGGIVRVSAEDVTFLAAQARGNARKRARLCAHPGSQDRLHEMLIVLARETYIRPHRHANKSESFHVVEGELDVVIFNDDGAVREVVRMGDYRSGKVFFYRLMEPCYHTVLINTPAALFHETTNGPFDRADTEFAPWAPAEGDPAGAAYTDNLRDSVGNAAARAA